jgi:uncharacterized protein
MRLFVDTWGWLLLADRRDPFHDRAVECYEEWSRGSGRVLSSNFVLDQTFALLFRRRPFDEAQRFASGLLASAFIGIEVVTEAPFQRAFELRRKFFDKPKISFTDLSSMAIMTELKLIDALTGDAHFNQVGLGFQTLPN